MKSNNVIQILFDVACSIEKAGNSRVACAVVKNGTIISIGFNQTKTHTLQQRFQKNRHSIYLHAEIAAISKARYVVDLSTCDLYIVRARKINGVFQHGLAKPCKGCYGAIKYFNFKNVYYTLNGK